MVVLRKDSAFAQAVNGMLARIAQSFPETLDAPVRAIVAGGAAVHLYTGHRVSDDLDVEFSRRVMVPSDMVLSYQDESGASRTLLFDSNYNATLGLLHEDYVEDALYVDQAGNDPRLRIFVLSPLDLAVSKLSRFADNDRQDIQALARRGLISAEGLRKRATEALVAYIGSTRMVEMNVQDAVAMVRDIELQRAANAHKGPCP